MAMGSSCLDVADAQRYCLGLYVSVTALSTEREIIMSHLQLVTMVVRDYDPAIDFFVNVLQFEVIEDVPSRTNDGRPKRWVVVRPVGATTGILLARADGEQQQAIVGQQFAILQRDVLCCHVRAEHRENLYF